MLFLGTFGEENSCINFYSNFFDFTGHLWERKFKLNYLPYSDFPVSIQGEPENSGIGRRLLDSSYDFKLSNLHELNELQWNYENYLMVFLNTSFSSSSPLNTFSLHLFYFSALFGQILISFAPVHNLDELNKIYLMRYFKLKNHRYL